VQYLLLILAMLLASPPAHAQGEPRAPALLLIADEDLKDPNFVRSVVFVVRQPDGGVIGLILNRPTELPLREVFPKAERLRGRKDRLFFGGPVMPQALAFVFHAGEVPSRATEVLPEIFLSGDAELLLELFQRGRPMERLKVFAGHSGWAPGQLEHEIARGGWLILPAEPDILFRPDPERLWRDLYERAKLKAERSVSYPDGNAALSSLAQPEPVSDGGASPLDPLPERAPEAGEACCQSLHAIAASSATARTNVPHSNWRFASIGFSSAVLPASSEPVPVRAGAIAFRARSPASPSAP
jgi:putative transcriptional regulator